jgi:hypothetical protein
MTRRDELVSAGLAFALFMQALTLLSFLAYDYEAHSQAPVKVTLETSP